MREVSDSLRLRRFCLIALSERVPEESTIRKLVRRLGPDVIEEITRVVIAKATNRSWLVIANRFRPAVSSAAGEPPVHLSVLSPRSRARDACP